MKQFTLFPIALCCSLLTLQADTWDKKTVVTFPQPVEVPGAVLQPGKYVLKLADSPSNRHIVRITNERQNQVYATILALPKYRQEPADRTILTFYEMPGGQPQALRSWFYPGDTVGQEFRYPKKRAVEIARAAVGKTPAPPKPQTVSKPSPRAPEIATTPATPEAPALEQRSAIPDTASNLPRLALIGVLALAAATATHFVSRRVV